METDRDMEKKQIENGGKLFCFLESALHDKYQMCFLYMYVIKNDHIYLKFYGLILFSTLRYHESRCFHKIFMPDVC